MLIFIQEKHFYVLLNLISYFQLLYHGSIHSDKKINVTGSLKNINMYKAFALRHLTIFLLKNIHKSIFKAIEFDKLMWIRNVTSSTL